MKKLISILMCLMLIQLPMSALPAVEVGFDRILVWDAISQYTDGTPLTVDTYVVGLFAVGSATPLFLVNSTDTEEPVLAFFALMAKAPVQYEFRVSAISTDDEISPWSGPLYAYRAKKNIPPPNNPHLKTP